MHEDTWLHALVTYLYSSYYTTQQKFLVFIIYVYRMWVMSDVTNTELIMASHPPIFMSTNPFGSPTCTTGSEQSKHECVAKLLYSNLVYNVW